MAITIHSRLTVTPDTIGFPSGPIKLTQTLSSDLGGEVATIVYDLDRRTNVEFKTPTGTTQELVLQGVEIPGTPTQRVDIVQLVETGGGTEVALVEIDQTIRSENTRRDSVTLAVQH
ncbi:MAG TPA: hypothetical protein VF017_09885 [Thermoanaerobaculia bacterium]|nr:hypothetical protein [Thermoanaerobaculia bacterium]